MPRAVPYTKGAHELARGVGLPATRRRVGPLQRRADRQRRRRHLNAGRHLFDLELTADMLTALRQATPTAERITTVVNTHAQR
jgi:hypothetical protein